MLLFHIPYLHRICNYLQQPTESLIFTIKALLLLRYLKTLLLCFAKQLFEKQFKPIKSIQIQWNDLGRTLYIDL